MTNFVSLRKLVDELLTRADETRAYLNLETGEVFSFSEDEVSAMESGLWSNDDNEKKEFLDHVAQVKNPDTYLELPGKYEIHEYRMMEMFSSEFPDPRISEILLEKIRGAGAFRRFKATIHHHGIEKSWYAFRDAAYKEFAIDWLEGHAIPYQDDMKS